MSISRFLMQAAAGNTASRMDFVGGRTGVVTGTQTPSFSLTGLSGGLASSPSAGDIVVVSVCMLSFTNRNLVCTTSGYTEIVDGINDGTNDFVQLGVYYKVLSSAETSVAFDLGESINSSFVCHVWRNPDAVSPMDATAKTASQQNAFANSPSITTVTDNAIVLSIFGSNGPANDPVVAPSGMSNNFNINENSTGIGMCSIEVSSAGAYDPPPWSGFAGSINGFYFFSATVALRPSQ